jgi:staphylococcal nuclease domain-containing protein 1
MNDGRGIHSSKEVSLPRIVDASETSARATQYLHSWKRAGRHLAVVDFVSSGSRFKLFMPKENARITFVLAGIRAPKASRNPAEKADPFGAESLRFSSKFLQRDVEILFDSTDKQGGFIGTMYVGGTDVAVGLVRAGLASVYSYPTEQLLTGRDLLAAEEEAKAQRKNLWVNYGNDVRENVVNIGATALPAEYFDVFVSSIKKSDPFGFSIQLLEPSRE